jgi:hypothetical protein
MRESSGSGKSPKPFGCKKKLNMSESFAEKPLRLMEREVSESVSPKALLAAEL